MARGRLSSDDSTVPDTLPTAADASSPNSKRDDEDMARLGKEQRLKRNFGLIGIVGLTCATMGSWEAVILGSGVVFLNGGPTAAVIGLIVGWVGSFLQMLVYAELASMIPLSGGQYNWVAILSPPRLRNFLSYVVGWFTMLFWHAAMASVVYIAGSLIQYLAVTTYGYTPYPWHICLTSYAILLAASVLNVFFSWILPTFEALVLLIHVAGFFIVLVAMVYLTPTKHSPDFVFATYLNNGGWPSVGTSVLVVFPSVFNAFAGIDTAAHLSEEIVNAAAVVPQAMITSLSINGVLGFAMLVAYLFCLGPLDSVVNTLSQGGLPIVDVFVTATNSVPGGVGLTVVTLIPLMGGALGVMATVSRSTWAFAREDGLPGSHYISRVVGRNHVPVNSVLLSIVIQLVLAAIGIGSPTALQAFFNLNIIGFYGTFIVVGGVMLHRRLTAPNLHWGPFTLGRLGVPVTVLALAYSVFGFFFSFWPAVASPDAANFNWGLVVFFAVALLSVGWWVLRAHRTYTGPKIERPGAYFLETVAPGEPK